MSQSTEETEMFKRIKREAAEKRERKKHICRFLVNIALLVAMILITFFGIVHILGAGKR